MYRGDKGDHTAKTGRVMRYNNTSWDWSGPGDLCWKLRETQEIKGKMTARVGSDAHTM